MPRTRSLAWSELKVGVLTIVALVIVGLTIFALTGSRGFFWQRYSLKTRFDNVAGLKSGSPVRVAGYEVGQVTDLVFTGEKVDVTFEVNKLQRERITTGSIAKLGSVSLLGESAVDITPSMRGTPLAEWEYVPQGKTPASFSDITDQANEGIGELTKLLKDARGGRGTIGKLLTDEQLYADLTRFVTTAGELVRGIQQGQGTLGKLIKDPVAAQALEASLKNLEAMTRQINAGEGSIGKLLKDETFARSLTDTTSNLKELTTKLNRGEGTAGKLLTDPALFNRLTSLTERFEQLLNQLNAGQGTAGLLLKDKQLYENMNGVVSDLRSLVADIKKDPKKFLNVKISIF
jgi:phospholipid/cholesterol/gamma-HCH transport system substrate-binding protein